MSGDVVSKAEISDHGLWDVPELHAVLAPFPFCLYFPHNVLQHSIEDHWADRIPLLGALIDPY